MNKKLCKLIMELIFIFILPIAFMLISVKSEVVNTYDENGNVLTTEKIFDFSEDTILRDYNDNLQYKNYLNYNMLVNGFNNQSYYYEELTSNKIKVLNVLTSGSSVSYLSLDIPYNHKIYMYYNSDFEPVSSGSSLFIYWYTGSIYTGISYNQNYYYDFYINAYTMSNEINIRLDNSDYIDKSITLYVYDITEMFGNGYEPTTKEELDSILNSLDVNKNEYVDNEILEYYSNDIISNNYEINYTWYSKLFNELYDDLQINNNIVLKLITTYIILWVIMFLVWHLLYRFVDFLVHLFDRKE